MMNFIAKYHTVPLVLCGIMCASNDFCGSFGNLLQDPTVPIPTVVGKSILAFGTGFFRGYSYLYAVGHNVFLEDSNRLITDNKMPIQERMLWVNWKR